MLVRTLQHCIVGEQGDVKVSKRDQRDHFLPSRRLRQEQREEHVHLALDRKTRQRTSGHQAADQRKMHQLALYETQTGVLQQVFCLKRAVQQKGKSRQEVVYGLTNLPPAQGSADYLLAGVRRHWAIENDPFNFAIYFHRLNSA